MSEKTDSDRTLPEVRSAIRLIRKQRVLLDADLARFYGVTTKRLNEAVKRNRDRFPADFAFQLNEREYASLRCDPAAGKAQHGENERGVNMWAHLEATAGSGMRSQFATASAKRNIRHYPYAFTEHGALMAASILKSKRAVEMSVFVVRAFVRIREQLAASTALAKRLAEIEKTLLTHDQALIDLYGQLRPLLLPPPEPPHKPIGFSVREKRARYSAKGRSLPTRH